MIWDYINLISRRLGLWSGLSIIAGLALLMFGTAFWQAFGIQAIFWGIVDGVIAWFGFKRAQRHLGKSSSLQVEEQEAKKIRKLLWINSALDVLYIAGGTAILFFLSQLGLFWQGTGWGIIAQGGFLYLFDMWHAAHVPEPLQLPLLPLFTHPDHASFLIEAGKPAAILIHSFPGTALELRQLGHAIHTIGWTVRGVCLPGFGVDLASIIQYNNTDWVDAIHHEITTLMSKGHTPVILIGIAFGSALSIQVAAKQPIDGLVLIAPRAWKESRIGKVVLDFIRALLPHSVKPFQHISSDQPEFIKVFEQYLPEINLEIQEQAEEMRHLRIPLYILDQLREVGREGLTAAGKVHQPTLVIDGNQYVPIHPKSKAQLKKSLGGPVTCVSVNGNYQLTMPHNPAFQEIVNHITHFAVQITAASHTKNQILRHIQDGDHGLKSMEGKIHGRFD